MCNDHPYLHNPDTCPRAKLDEALNSGMFHVIQRAAELDFQLDAGFMHDLADTPADEYLTMKLLRLERNKYQNEQLERQKQHIPSIPSR